MLTQIFKLTGFFVLVITGGLLFYTSFFLFIYIKQYDADPHSFYAVRIHELEYYLAHIAIAAAAGVLVLRKNSWGWILLLFILLFMMAYCVSGGHARFAGKSLYSPIFWGVMGLPLLALLEIPPVRRYFQIKWYHDAILVGLFAIDMTIFYFLPDYWY